MYNKKAHLHFVGIGGIGMSGIAKILRFQGYTISGCDADVEQQSVYDLQALGCSIYKGNNTDRCKDDSIDILVYSSAIQAQNPEIKAAQLRNIPTISRALMLAEVMRTKFSIAVSGSHGKTTTTSLISHILIEAKKDPTVIIGGRLKTISANAQYGLGDFLVAEADESDRSIVHLQASIAVVTNINLEHLDTYSDIEDIKATFKQFINNLPFYGTAIVCIDNVHVRALLPLTHIRTIKYGFDSDADIYPAQVRLESDHSVFDCYYKGTLLGTVTTHMPGRHNLLNSLAAIASALEVEIPFETIKDALATFKGVERRFSYHGMYKGAELFDDYGHHPVEIANTVAVALQRKKNNLTVVFEPHRYSRLHKLWDLFLDTFASLPIDNLIVTDIYSASESPIESITAQRFVHELQQRKGQCRVTYAQDFEAIQAHLDTIINVDDLVLLQGAGKINQLAKKLLQ